MIHQYNKWHHKVFFILIITPMVWTAPITAQLRDIAEQENISTTETPVIDIVPVNDFNEPTQQSRASEDQKTALVSNKPRTIRSINIRGNTFISTDAILRYVPFSIGEVFNPLKTRSFIKILYRSLNLFRNITVKARNIGTQEIDLYIDIEEKSPLKAIIFDGNRQVSETDIRKKINLDLPAVDAEELKPLAQKIKQLYIEKGYFTAAIDTKLVIDTDGRAIAAFLIDEGRKSLVKRIIFTGNNHFSSKELRSIIYTHEDWVLGFMDKSGVYHPERTEYGDRHMIEQYYHNRGYMEAKVVNIIKEMDARNQLTLTFEIEEGDIYTINTVEIPGYNIVSEEFLRASVPVQPGMPYSHEKIMDTIKALEFLWGNYGYTFAHINPSIEPDKETKTVNVSFTSDLGDKVIVNNVTIRGNRKTRDKIIRRRLLVEEGEMLTNSKLEVSKTNVESLGYFDPRDGVNWKINRIGQDKVDLDLMIKEVRTGHFNAQLGFGAAELNSPASGISFKLGVSDTNLFGAGIHLNTEASFAKNEQTFILHIAEPWLFDKPLSGAFDFYHKRPTYDELHNITPASVTAKVTGGALSLGFVTPARAPFLSNTSFMTSLGIDNIRYPKQPTSKILSLTDINDIVSANKEYNSILEKEFTQGTFVWLANNMEQDHRNHPIHTSRGHRWKVTSKIAIPSFGDNIGFYKLTADASWYTPLINEFDLIFKLRGFLGIIAQFGSKIIPFSELFHIGGVASVRGFNFGQIGPKFEGDTIGAKKAFFWNAELIFPITSDLNMKGVVFYDGGAGFDNPYLNGIQSKFISGNNFDYRHSVGFGIRLLQPMPVRVDWAFKIDPRKNKLDPSRSESSHEIHFGMSYDW